MDILWFRVHGMTLIACGACRDGQAQEENLAAWASDLALVHPWGFELTGICVPVLLLPGGQDKFIHFAHGQ